MSGEWVLARKILLNFGEGWDLVRRFESFG
jgi:hypothetical protein